MNELFYTLQSLVMRGATEIFVSAGNPVTCRLNGRLRKPSHSTEPSDTDALFRIVGGPEQQMNLQEYGSAEFSYDFGRMFSGNFSVFKQRGLTAIVFRRNDNALGTSKNAG